MTFGDRLADLRKKRKWSQDDLAKILKIGKSTLSMYETNQRKPDHDMLIKIADLFEVSTDYLLGRIDYGLLTETPKSNPNEPAPDLAETLIHYIDVLKLPDEEIANRMHLTIDKIALSKDEALGFIAFVRATRAVKQATGTIPFISH